MVVEGVLLFFKCIYLKKAIVMVIDLLYYQLWILGKRRMGLTFKKKNIIRYMKEYRGVTRYFPSKEKKNAKRMFYSKNLIDFTSYLALP